MHQDLRSYLAVLRREKQLVEIDAQVDPRLEAAEIHRRIIAQEGPALLFRNIQGAAFPLVTNLFGNRRRIELAFGPQPEQLVREAATLPHTLLPPKLSRLWSKRWVLSRLLRVGTRLRGAGPITEFVEQKGQLERFPLLTTWEEDGGPFFTLPLVYTEHPQNKVHNLGIYRMQRFDDSSTGFHAQIGKGAGYHLSVARALGQNLPVNVSIGGPPALMLAAIAPLPENVPELLLASLLQGSRVKLARNPLGPLPALAEAEFTLVGEVNPLELRPEGPFGDHYGYYSLQHDYPVFRCHGMLRRKDPICTATVVGKPRQEDFFLGDYVQELLAPLFPIVMPTVSDLWSYGETGYHSLAAAVVKQRFKREALVSAFRILGEGQLALTKFLLTVDRPMDLRNFKEVLEFVLERANFKSDLYVFGHTAMDSLDYTGPKINEGSKGVLVGAGDPVRELPAAFEGALPDGIAHAIPFCRGCLVLDGVPFSQDPDHLRRIISHSDFALWPLLVLVDDAPAATASTADFLWTTFTRFEPAGDIHSSGTMIVRNHVEHFRPILIDARMKPWYPKELACDEATDRLVTRRWSEYFPSGAI